MFDLLSDENGLQTLIDLGFSNILGGGNGGGSGAAKGPDLGGGGVNLKDNQNVVNYWIAK
jgi:hypothetical protein